METVYRDYAPKDVKFYYIYKSLAHPEQGGYVRPINLKERLMHVQEAKRVTGTKISWLVDSLQNDVKHALGDAPNSEFIIDAEGKVVGKRTWSNPGMLRQDLERLVGPVETPTTVESLGLKTAAPPKGAKSGVVPPMEYHGDLQALVTEPQFEKSSEEAFYVKLRAEAESAVMKTGKGKLYLGFHLDPLYRVHWNNLAPVLSYEVTAPKGVTITPSRGKGPKLEESADIDAREFLLDVDSPSAVTEPLKVKVTYYPCSDDEGWCRRVSQEYIVQMQVDLDGGRPTARGSFTSFFLQVMPIIRVLDADGDSALSAQEIAVASDSLKKLDANDDGVITVDELRPDMSRVGKSQ